MKNEDRNYSEDEVVFTIKSLVHKTIHDIDLRISNVHSDDYYKGTIERYHNFELDELITRLAKLSLTHTITWISVVREQPLLNIYIEESENHDTNITASTINIISDVLGGMTFPNIFEISTTTVGVNGIYIPKTYENLVGYISTNY